MLRERLQQISDGGNIDQHNQQVAALAQEHPHSIVALASKYDLGHYTCLVHALQFTAHSKYCGVAEYHDVFAGAEFAHWLLDRGVLEEIPEADTKGGDLAMYFDADGKFKHAGLVRGAGLVESKWGTQGLYEHPLLEVPSSYGNDIRFFRQIPFEAAIEHFYDFAEDKGVPF